MLIPQFVAADFIILQEAAVCEVRDCDEEAFPLWTERNPSYFSKNVNLCKISQHRVRAKVKSIVSILVVCKYAAYYSYEAPRHTSCRLS